MIISTWPEMEPAESCTPHGRKQECSQIPFKLLENNQTSIVGDVPDLNVPVAISKAQYRCELRKMRPSHRC